MTLARPPLQFSRLGKTRTAFLLGVERIRATTDLGIVGTAYAPKRALAKMTKGRAGPHGWNVGPPGKEPPTACHLKRARPRSRPAAYGCPAL